MAYRAEVFRDNILVTVDKLVRGLDAEAPVTIVDVRWQLDRPDGRADYERGHIPGAVYADLEAELSDHSVTGRGRHPLPSGSALQDTLRRWGARPDVPIVVYDNWNRAGSARAWWVLRAAGLHNVRILDGGLAAWTAAGHELATGNVHPEPSDIEIVRDDLTDGELPTLTAADAATTSDRGILVDARAPQRFRGEAEPVDPVAGHIPGARNVPGTAVLDENGFFRPATELEELFAAAGATHAPAVGVYCGSGVTAAVDIAALTILGIDAALFPGSWSQWCADGSRPVAVGE